MNNYNNIWHLDRSARDESITLPIAKGPVLKPEPMRVTTSTFYPMNSEELWILLCSPKQTAKEKTSSKNITRENWKTQQTWLKLPTSSPWSKLVVGLVAVPFSACFTLPLNSTALCSKCALVKGQDHGNDVWWCGEWIYPGGFLFPSLLCSRSCYYHDFYSAF